tara:strand:- start:326 stop:631 length:306 start_codon:yes stop_codon:yes gene_type:complete
VREVRLSKRASKKLDKLLHYLETAWSYKVKSDFIKKLNKAINQIARYPESAEKSAIVKGLHRMVVTKQTTFYYRFNAKSVTIVTLFDTRMHPGKIKDQTRF